MSNIRKILNEEANKLDHNKDIKGHGNVANYLIVLQFKDNHYHSIVPDDPKLLQEMMEHLLAAVHERATKGGRIIVPGYKWID